MLGVSPLTLAQGGIRTEKGGFVNLFFLKFERGLLDSFDFRWV